MKYHSNEDLIGLKAISNYLCAPQVVFSCLFVIHTIFNGCLERQMSMLPKVIYMFIYLFIYFVNFIFILCLNVLTINKHFDKQSQTGKKNIPIILHTQQCPLSFVLFLKTFSLTSY